MLHVSQIVNETFICNSWDIVSINSEIAWHRFGHAFC